jgi:hypothetical protein
VITKAITRQLSWVQAAGILGISARHMRRLRHKVERWGMSAVMDQRGGRPRRKRIKAGTIELLCRLKRDVYPDFSLRHFYEIPRKFIDRVCDTMERANWHTFQVLTKRSSLMRDFLRRRYADGRGPLHVWFGVSVEDGSKKSRIRHLQEAPAGVRFLSILEYTPSLQGIHC